MRIRFIDGTFTSIEGLEGVRYLWNNKIHTVAGLVTYTDGKVNNVIYCKKVTEKLESNTVYVVKQKKILRTVYIFIHELSHWIVYKIYGNGSGNNSLHEFIDKYLK